MSVTTSTREMSQVIKFTITEDLCMSVCVGRYYKMVDRPIV